MKQSKEHVAASIASRSNKAIDAVNRAIDHCRDHAPDIPVERFLAQAIADGIAGAFETAGWNIPADRWRKAARAIGDIEFTGRLLLK